MARTRGRAAGIGPSARPASVQAFPPAGNLPVGLDTIPEDSDDPLKTNLPRVTCTAPAPTRSPTPTTDPTDPPSTLEPTQTDKPGGPKNPEPTLPPPDPSGSLTLRIGVPRQPTG